ncbi:D-alanyl-D-alanine dipeptidase [Streptomyces sp. 2231.1]|uniref:M15 family metallopeptidase n=1 Tax=Streptomyces sp. 2231.1 TaxID=1855347 RepID=UPI000896AE9C|nr:M15 family metallopeptidase [Streptomyces sp. 2231.1]SEC11376.1 D-alanyl-D-alanine dipeptidase [Streptomyces sp. 2231.1]
MSEIILMSDPRVAAVPVHECGEPLVDVRRGPLLVDLRKQDDSDAFFYLREGVLERLLQAQAHLPAGLGFLVVEGYRPPALQRRYFEKYAARLRAEQPGWTDEQIRSAVSRFVSPPEIAPHSAGAAVDLTLVDADGRELDLGTPMNATPEESAGACYTDAAGISAQARAHREILGRVLTAVGLVNYPTEWWHWSFGDRYWALATAAASACYGPSLHGVHE